MLINSFAAWGIVEPKRLEDVKRVCGGTAFAFVSRLKDGRSFFLVKTALVEVELQTNHISASIRGLNIRWDGERERLTVRRQLICPVEMYYWQDPAGVVASQNLGTLLTLIPEATLSDDAAAYHFLYRSVPGGKTYFRGVSRLKLGEEFVCDADGKSNRMVERLKDLTHRRPSASSVEEIDSLLTTSVGNSINGYEDVSALLLSGGVDSSVLQGKVNQVLTTPTRRSLSYVIDLPSFVPEVHNARRASDHFGTHHEFYHLGPDVYIDSLLRAYAILGQPPHHEQLSFAVPFMDEVRQRQPYLRRLVSGQGADSLFGLRVAQKIERARKRSRLGSGVGDWLERLGFGRVFDRSLKDLLSEESGHAYVLNSLSMYTDPVAALACFGNESLGAVMRERVALEIESLGSDDLLERAHGVAALGEACDTASLRQQIGAAFGLELVFPYFERELVGAVFSFPLHGRYYSGRTKPLLRDMLVRQGGAHLMGARKYGGGFARDLRAWMKSGLLRPLVMAIRRPDFVPPRIFEQKLADPDWFTWNLLTYDLLVKTIEDRETR